MGCGWVAGWVGLMRIMPRCGSILQARTCKILSFAKNLRWGRVWQLTKKLTLSFVWLCMIVHDYVWICTTMYDYAWLFTYIYNYVWLCMTRYDYVWLCLTIYDFVGLWEKEREWEQFKNFFILLQTFQNMWIFR